MDLYNIRQKLNNGIPITEIPLRVTYYSRVSTDHLEQQKSLKNQIDHFDELIKNNNHWTYIDGYIDEGISGTTDYKRNNFMKMIEDAKNQKFDLIITKEISRFSRNTFDSIKYTRELLSYGIAVLFINDNINTALPDSELRLTIMASMAQDEIRRLSERVKFGMNRSIKNGTILGNNMLYGYKKDNITGNLIIIEKEAYIIKKIFNLYVIDNYSITNIVKILNNKNILTRHNKKWCPSTITRMLKNPKYKGFYCGRKTEIIDYMTKKVRNIPESNWIIYEDKIKIPPIIEKELWEKANEKLKKRSKTFGNDHKDSKIIYQNRYPLSAKIYCANHNELFHRRKQCTASNDITWICNKYLKEGKKACNSPNIRESEIYTIIYDIIDLSEIKLSNITNILLEIYKDTIKDNKELSELKKQKDKIIAKKDKLLELTIENNISNIEFKNKNNELDNELNIINKNIEILEQNKDNNTDLEHQIKEIIKDKNIKIALINLLLKKIIVYKTNNNKENIELKIYFNFSNSFPKKEPFIKKKYEFKRGYNTTGTRRYIIKYQVYPYFFL